MSEIQSQYVKKILRGVGTAPVECGEAFAPSNIALCKYWGKRDPVLNLPVNSSLSVSLGKLGTRTAVRFADRNRIELNGKEVSPEDTFAVRILEFLQLFFPMIGNVHFDVRTANNIPTAAGLASSASGFAALVLALDNLMGWGLDRKQLSMLARLGSGSAARSVYDGFVCWHAGTRKDGRDSFAEPISSDWKEFRIGILEISKDWKPVSSRAGMKRTVETSELYRSWPRQAADDLEMLRLAIADKDFPMLGKTAENNALAMHATMLSAWPPLIYWQPETIAQIHRVHQVRSEGLDVYLTIDAGPNLKLLFTEETEKLVKSFFPGLQVICPID
ncbi:MAG: diphosphomevalonate decarboxylase [Kiritimatiellales bacterium]|nr:diphosphomevalonate decarboxylase [Kiritimatiellales bacterium]